ncbi:ribbon-helix-helix domain-containing protein [Rhodococcus erythropolis]|jgi:Arc/MetJ-type ribon-helix-helix transcriptional regulator|nr:ribbon-helix-helix domain-containing protein [Rhodococcus erythropolis]
MVVPNRIPLRYHQYMSTQIAVRLPDEIVEFLDDEVREHRAASRASLVLRALERERRRQIAARDAEILSAATSEHDLSPLAHHAVNRLPTGST